MDNMKVDKTPFVIAGSDNKPIRGDIWRRQEAKPQSVLVLVHGFKGFKDWGFFPYLAGKLAGEFGAAVTFNFSHSGIGEDLQSFSELDLFQANRFAYEENDLLTVLKAIQEESVASVSGLGDAKLAIVGHSRAGVSVIRALGQKKAEQVAAAVLLASVSQYPRLSEQEVSEWRSRGVYQVENKRTGQMLPLGLALLEELLLGEGVVENCAKNMRQPTLIVHGEADESVSIESARQLSTWIPNNELLTLQGAGHAFGSAHPFSGTTPDLEKVLAASCGFIRKQLAS